MAPPVMKVGLGTWLVNVLSRPPRVVGRAGQCHALAKPPPCMLHGGRHGEWGYAVMCGGSFGPQSVNFGVDAPGWCLWCDDENFSIPNPFYYLGAFFAFLDSGNPNVQPFTLDDDWDPHRPDDTAHARREARLRRRRGQQRGRDADRRVGRGERRR